MNKQRVVITGLGAITPIGIGTDVFFSNLLKGTNGVAEISHFDASEYRSKLAAEVKGFQAEDWIDKKSASRMDRFTHFAVAAASLAMDDSGLESFDENRAGVIVGSGIGGANTLEESFAKLNEKGPRGLSPFYVSRMLVNMSASMISIKYGLKGFIGAPSLACSTSSNSIGDAFRVLQRGEADIMFAGGSEACITPLPFGCFCATRSMTTNNDPNTASRPFDKNRDGFVMGEGAGIVVLENLEHARKRGARIYAEITGYGNTADAYHLTAPDPESKGMIRAMQNAISDAGVLPEEVDYINAHGTSTVLNDKGESFAISQIFDNKVKVSSNKSMVGHLMAAAGAVEFIAMTLTVFNNKIPPTINYTTPDPDCTLDYVINGSENITVNVALSNSFGFGGGNATLVIKKFI